MKKVENHCSIYYLTLWPFTNVISFNFKRFQPDLK